MITTILSEKEREREPEFWFSSLASFLSPSWFLFPFSSLGCRPFCSLPLSPFNHAFPFCCLLFISSPTIRHYSTFGPFGESPEDILIVRRECTCSERDEKRIRITKTHLCLASGEL